MSNHVGYMVMVTQRYIRVAILCLAFTLCFASAGLRSLAQNVKILNKDMKAPIIQLFYPEKNETVVAAGIGSVENVKRIIREPSSDGLPLADRELFLWNAQYTYAGTIPTRPATVKFTFFVNHRLSTYKKASDFSVSADNNVVEQGKYVFEQQTFSGEKKPDTREVLSIEISAKAFLSIAHAQEAQIKVGPATYKLNGDQRNHLRALAATFK